MIESKEVHSLAAQYGLDPLTASILIHRQMASPEKIAYFLEGSERFLHNPFIFPEMEKSVNRVLLAAREDEKVLIIGDRDVDGVAATVIMVEALRMVGIESQWQVPVGEADYGIDFETLQESAKAGVSLVVAVDCGITSFDEIKLAGELGMDVLVFDHHMPRGDKLPNAYAIVNPRIPGSYPFDGLCAAAIASKFQWALSLAQSPLQDYCLLIARQEAGEIEIEAVQMHNLLESSRLSVSSAAGGADRDKLQDYIGTRPIISYNCIAQIPLVSAFFNGSEVHIIDAAPEIAAAFPKLENLSLTELEANSRIARYSPQEIGPLSTLRNLMVSMQLNSMQSHFEVWRRGLDLVALGTLADLMPLWDENRILVRMGIDRINQIGGERRIALRELLIKLRLHERRIATTEVSWQICPLINAAGRMGQADIAARLFFETNPIAITKLAHKLFELNKKRRALGEYLWEKLLPRAYQSLNDFSGKMLILVDSEIPRGITGILATRFQKALSPVAVIITVKDEKASGSIRCNSTINALSWLESASHIFEDFGGHPQAGGFRIPSAEIAQLNQISQKWINRVKPGKTESTRPSVDVELSHQEISRLGLEGIEDVLKRLEPYGQGFRPLIFLTREVKVFQANLVGKPRNKHLKLLVSLGSNRWPAFWWDGAENYGSLIKIDKEVDLVYKLDRDYWRGNDARRLTILEASPCEL